MKRFSLMINRIAFVIVLLSIPFFSYSQVVLNADGPGNTYELINSVLAPGGDAVENPECIHPEFGRHIAEVWDTDLNQNVFEFYMHVTPDNDRCVATDRQRIEIKTYELSPDNLKGVVGETITYKWKFKINTGYQPSSSFTHLHQIKAVGGNDGNPIFTLTPRKGSPNKMELIHDNTTKVAIVNLSLFEGIWVECTEVIYVHSTSGTYSMTIKKVSDGTTILSYSNNSIMTIRSDNTFIRPKWGIYRSLNTPTDLRDEAVRFAGFSIQEGTAPVKLDQIITFNALPAKIVGDTDFSPGATASSGLAVSYASSNTAVATMVGSNIHIVGAGASTITASQAGDATYNAAPNVLQTLSVSAAQKQDQTITFAALPVKVYGDADFTLGATASSGLTVSYLSSNTAVATIVSSNIHIVGAGTSTITASQGGDANYNAAPDVPQVLTVSKANQTITFNALPAKVVGNADFSPGATASSGLAVSYTSSNTAVATIVSNNIHIVGAGTSVITASQVGNTNYNAATDIPQSLTVTAAPTIYNYVPTSTSITSGSRSSGSYTNLATNNASYYVVKSTTSGTRKTDWYGSVTISQAPTSVTKLTINYDGKNSASKTQVLSLYNWSTSAWTQIDSRTVSTTDVVITNTQTSPANYISSTGQIRLRIYTSGGTSNYTNSGDWMQFVVETALAKQGAVAGEAQSPTVDAVQVAQPVGYRLVSNYPNPFNPSTTLRYEIVENAHVQMVVYDIRGAKVKELVNDMKPSGVYEVRFDALSLASGVYYVRFVAIPANGMQCIVSTHKILLMK
jgi:hypothetical protein